MRRHKNCARIDSSQMPPLGRQVLLKGSKHQLDHEFDEDNNDEHNKFQNCDEDNVDALEEREHTDEDEKKAVRITRYSLRENTRKAKKVKREMQIYKKSRRDKCQKMIVGGSINPWSAERYEAVERNVSEVMKSEGEVFKSPILSPDPRFEATKRIDDTGLLDHPLKHVSIKLVPGGAECFRRRYDVDGKKEYWLESADSTLVQVNQQTKKLLDISDSVTGMKQMMERHKNRTRLVSSQMPPPGRQLLQSNDNKNIGGKHFDVGCVYEVVHLSLPTGSPVKMKSICVVMVTENTKLNVTVRYPRTESLGNYPSHDKMNSADIYPFLDEAFFTGTHLSGKVLHHQISAQEFDDNNHSKGFWFIKNSRGVAVLCGIFNKETTTPLLSQLKINGLVRWGSRRQVKFLNRQGDSSSNCQLSSKSFIHGSKEKMVHESDEDINGENDDEAGKVFHHQISVQEFDDDNHFEGFWLIRNSPEVALREIFNKETTTPLMSQLKINGMVRCGSRRQVKFLNRQGDSSGNHPWSSASLFDGSKEKRDHESDEDNNDENSKDANCDEDNEDAEKERKDTDEDDKKVGRWLKRADSALVQVETQKKQIPDISDSAVGVKESLPLSTSRLSETRQSRGGGPKRPLESDKAVKEAPRKRSKGDKAVKVAGSSIQIEEGIDLNKCLLFDIFKDGKNERFNTPIADQRGHRNCGPVSICDCVGLTFAIQTQTHNPKLSAQEPITWMPIQEPSYLLDPELVKDIYIEEGTTNRSFPMCMPDVFNFVRENGVHLEANCPFVGSCNMKFQVDVKKFEKMRSSFVKDKPRERYSIDSFKHLSIDKNEGSEDAIIEEVKAALQAGRPVNGMLWASEDFVTFDGHGIFDKDLDGKADHIVMITGYGEYNYIKFFKIKNSWSSKWGNGGDAFVTIRQIREFAYVDGDVYCMGPTPPKRIMIFYTTEATERLAKVFAEESNRKYAFSQSKNFRHSEVIFIPNDLEDYASEIPEFKEKFKKESTALFLLDNNDFDEDYLKAFYDFLTKEKKSKLFKDFRYAVFGLHPKAQETDRKLNMLGAKRMTTMVMGEGEFLRWQSSIWTELDKEYRVEKANEGCQSRGGKL